uniref:UPF3 domain-containing protein n=1 Tax=Acrobeloides nanus TaxID=290746 RepID=A0A914CHV1_9BILA
MSSIGTGADNTTGKSKSSAKKKFIKVVLRRLPFGIEKDELLEQLSPLPPYETFWFRNANLDLLPFAFARAYIVFKEESDAIAFRDQFNGYVFVDKKGNESMGIVEQAPYPDYPKDKRDCAKDSDKHVGTLNEHADYLKFLDEYNSLVSKKVTNFDELVKEIEEKSRTLKKGSVQETPLTDYLYKIAMEKAQRRNRFDRRYGKFEKPAAKSGKWGEREERKPAKEAAFPRNKLEVKDKKLKSHEKFNSDAKGRFSATKNERAPPTKADSNNTDKNPSKFEEKKVISSKPKPTKDKPETVPEKAIKIMKRDEPRSKEIPTKTPAKDKENKPVPEKLKEPAIEKKVNEEPQKPAETIKADKTTTQPKRNKDRPERQIYQPRARKPVVEKSQENIQSKSDDPATT